jgi:hypothetical protein
MRRTQLSSLVILLALAIAGPAVADTSQTVTIPWNGTWRSAPEATPETPLIVDVALGDKPQFECEGCSAEGLTTTVTFKDAHDRAADDLDQMGKQHSEYVGPQVDFSRGDLRYPGNTSGFPFKSLAFEIDASKVIPGALWINTFVPVGYLTYNVENPPPGLQHAYVQPGPDSQVPLANGDHRLVLTNYPHSSTWEIVHDLFKLTGSSIFAGGDLALDGKITLAEILKSGGLRYQAFASYQSSVRAKLTVTAAVAKRLKLKSATLGTGTLDILTRNGTNGRVALSPAIKQRLAALAKKGKPKFAALLTLDATGLTPDFRDTRKIRVLVG